MLKKGSQLFNKCLAISLYSKNSCEVWRQSSSFLNLQHALKIAVSTEEYVTNVKAYQYGSSFDVKSIYNAFHGPKILLRGRCIGLVPQSTYQEIDYNPPEAVSQTLEELCKLPGHEQSSIPKAYSQLLKTYGIVSHCGIFGVKDDKHKIVDLRQLVLVHSYGTVVFFTSQENKDAGFAQEHLTKFLTGPHSSPQIEELTVVVKPSVKEWVKKQPDQLILQELDLGNMQVIADILSHSAALHFYSSQVASVLSALRATKELSLERKGRWSRSPAVDKELTRIIAKANMCSLELVSKLRGLQPSRLAWQSDMYASVAKLLQDDYELDTRWEALLAQLQEVQDEARYDLATNHSMAYKQLSNMVVIVLAILTAIHFVTMPAWYSIPPFDAFG